MRLTIPHIRSSAPPDLRRWGRSYVTGTHQGILNRRVAQGFFVLQAMYFLAVIERGLRGPLPALCNRLGLRLGVNVGSVSAGDIEWAAWMNVRRTCGRAARIVRYWPFGDTCLRRALLVAAFHRDLNPSVVLGVRRGDDATVLAHAWVEVAGLSLDPASTTYASFPVALAPRCAT